MTRKPFHELNFVQRYTTLPNTLFSRVDPAGLNDPALVCVSEDTAQLLDLDPDSLQSETALHVLSGNSIHSSWQPIAMKYTGHQFGYYNPDLGDGRGLLLSEVKNQNGETWDLHLKGAGMTPYSRQGDGRAVLRSSIREFLVSEAMAALGIPTTRALAVVDSQTPVMRERVETGAMVMRVAKSHIRFGHFEYCAFTQQIDLLKTLADHVIQHHFPTLIQQENPYLGLFESVLKSTTRLMAQWQTIGFAHGVMNTDNMSILGDTFDYGPYAFLDDYIPSYICNHSDHQGRYAFNQQPNIANWNLAVLAQALLPLCDKQSLINILETYSDEFQSAFIGIMAKKLGLDWLSEAQQPQLKTIIEETLSMLAKGRMDYTIFFRKLATHQGRMWLRDHTLDLNGFDEWHAHYTQIIANDPRTETERATAMNGVNPKYILRNYLAQKAIEDAQAGNYETVNALHQVLRKPFAEQPENEHFANFPPDWGKAMEISCSS